MEIYFQLVQNAEDLRSAIRGFEGTKTIGFDTETTELEPRDGELRLVQLSDGKKTTIVDLRKFSEVEGLRVADALEPLRKLIADQSIVKVAHNAKFDAKWVRHHLGCEINGIFDTYLASQLIAAGDSDRRHSLGDVAQFFTGIELDKTMQTSDWSASELSNTQLEYAVRDAAIMLQLREQIVDRLENDGLERAAKLEFECVSPIAEMELNGFHLDRDRWRAQLEKVSAAQAKAADELQELLSSGVAQASLFGRSEINLDSQAQVVGALQNLGVPIPDTTRAWQLQPLSEKYPVVEKLLKYRTVQKSMTSFGEGFLDLVNPTTGRIHADFRQIGAPTGRFSCSKPNLQQIPHDAAYRRCFTPAEGHKFVIADYSQIELRILADFSGDKKFIDSFVSGIDFHSSTASQVFGVGMENLTEAQRSFAKRLNFGIVYGIGASRFGMMTGLSQNEAENTMRRYFGTFRQLEEYLRNEGRRLLEERRVRSSSGRLLRLKFDDNDQIQRSAARRNGINMPIQGTSADILKRSLRLLHDNLTGSGAKLVNIIHDEVIVECPTAEAENAAAIVEKVMRTAGEEFVRAVPVKVDVRIADDWAK